MRDFILQLENVNEHFGAEMHNLMAELEELTR